MGEDAEPRHVLDDLESNFEERFEDYLHQKIREFGNTGASNDDVEEEGKASSSTGSMIEPNSEVEGREEEDDESVASWKEGKRDKFTARRQLNKNTRCDTDDGSLFEPQPITSTVHYQSGKKFLIVMMNPNTIVWCLILQTTRQWDS